MNLNIKFASLDFIKTLLNYIINNKNHEEIYSFID